MKPLIRSRDTGAIVRAGARGLVAAMAMTGARTVTAAMGPHEKSPPEAIVEKHLPLVYRLPERHREAVIELAHWTYGSAGGAAYGMLPERVRAHGASGPVYGLVFWLGFEIGIRPLLGVKHAHERRVAWRIVLALDHVLYGLVVAGRFAPEPSRRPRGRPGVTSALSMATTARERARRRSVRRRIGLSVAGGEGLGMRSRRLGRLSVRVRCPDSSSVRKRSR
ncbi:hypothetical protein ETD83_15955 [Actinomadura soli]|uniref:DUF1440 domain-containing protein n=1 Tax=Actinomadura soli TaxID=2508997 RepID=A0A5C4JBK5_9ACTN|nr:hypothetical protein [Actinomadura soli]TMR00749.1 hypothetical protein ETD83_15955 [Actinomadura soli]